MVSKHVIRKFVSAGLVVGAAVLSGCTPQTEAASPTASSDTNADTEAASSSAADEYPELPSYDDFPEPEINGEPLVLHDVGQLTLAPGAMFYSTVTGDAVTALTSAKITGEQITSISVTPTPTVPPGNTTPDVNCGFTVRGVGGAWTLITSSVVEHAADGADPAYYDLIYQGFDASLKVEWTSKPLGPFSTPPVCDATEGLYGGEMANGEYLIRNFDTFLVVVDLVNHTLTRSDLSNLIPWGNKFLTRDDQGGYRVLDPKTLTQVAYVPSRANGGVLDPTLIYPVVEYDKVDAYAIGDGLAIVDLDTGQATWVIQPDDPRFGVFLTATYYRDENLIVAKVADSGAEDAPTTVYVITPEGEVKWSVPNSRQCGSRGTTVVLYEDESAVVAYDLLTGARVAGPTSMACTSSTGGYVLGAEGRTVTIHRVA